MNVGDSSAEGEHATVVDNVVNDLPVVTAFASYCVFDTVDVFN